MSKTPGEKAKVKSLLSISHDKDVDGLNAAAIVWRYAKSKGLDFDVILTDYGSFDQVFSKVAKRRQTLIVITDLGIDENSIAPAIDGLSQAMTQGCRVVWLDHHRWNKHAIDSVLSLKNNPVLKVNHDYCAAEIAHKVLMPRDEISAELAKIAHDTDFNLREIDAASALTDLISVTRFAAMNKKQDVGIAVMPFLSKLAEDGIPGLWDDGSKRFKDNMLDQQVRQYRKEKLKKMKKSLADHCDQVIHNRLTRIVEIPAGVTTTDLGTFLADEKNLEIEGQKLKVADLLIALSQGGLLGFRRGSESTLCNEAAALFNGGGHPYAAGGEYGLYDDFQAVCDDIFLTLSKNKNWVVES
ncbi:MAG: DHH family phosphoesterase [Candidatus Thorarchaeota archaeon]|jgi:oligoribonuclease NrnB/cAMP/cGMP phosphodiesterase (DHH superfamily)